MNEKQLKKLGFLHDSKSQLCFLDVNYPEIELVKFDSDNFITVYCLTEKINALELRNVNTIEKVKQLIELLK